MKCLPLVLLSGVSAIAALGAAENPVAPLEQRDTVAVTYGAEHPSTWHQEAKRQEPPAPVTVFANATFGNATAVNATATVSEAKLRELASKLRLLYAYYATYKESRQTGLLNNILGLVGNILPPLEDVTDALRRVLIGENISIKEQLAIANALGE